MPSIQMKIRFIYLTFIVAVAIPQMLFGTKTYSIFHSAENMIEHGTLKQVGLQDHVIQPTSVESLYQSENSFIFSWTKDNENNIYFGTSNTASIYHMTDKGEVNLIEQFDKFLFVSAMVYWNGYVYAALNPGGTIVQIDLSNFQVVNEWKTNEQYIWKMMVMDNNRLFITTGLKARIYEITKPDLSKHQLIYESKQEDHFLAISSDAKSSLFFGGSAKGIVYKHNLKNKKTKALYQIEEGEIKEIVFRQKDQNLFVATAGFNLNGKKQKYNNQNQNMQAQRYLNENDNKNKVSGNQGELSQYISYFPFLQPSLSKKHKPPAKKLVFRYPKNFFNTVYQFDKSGKKKILTRHKNTLFLSLAIHKNGDVYIGTSKRGIIYKNDSKKLIELPDLEVLSLQFIDVNTIIATTGVQGGMYRINLKPSGKGEYTSNVIQLENIVHWGKIKVNPLSKDRTIDVYTRSGNTLEPDDTWSDWQAVGNKNQFRIASPSAMNLQYKINFNKPTSQVESLEIFYRFKNRTPEIEQLSIIQQPLYKLPKEIIDAIEQRYWVPSIYVIHWKASDPDKDNLSYTVQFKENKTDSEWRMIEKDLFDNRLIIDSSRIPDGEYLFSITASDISINMEDSLTYTKISRPIYIDNTPPTFKEVKIKPSKTGIVIQFEVADNAILKACGFSLNLNSFQLLHPKSGFYDSESGMFQIEIKKSTLKEKNNILVLQAVDHSNNISRYIVKLDE